MKIFFSGDFCPNNRVRDLINNEDVSQIFGNLKEVLDSVDYSVVNLECPIEPENKIAINKVGPALSTNEKAIRVLKEAGFNLLTLANNHIKDFGEEGVSSTINCIKKNALDYVGAGFGINEARKIFYIESEVGKIGIINITENEFSTTVNEEYGAYGLDIIDNTYVIKEAKKEADLVIIVYHGGHEGYQLPSPRMKRLFHYFVDCGVDSIICHHSHCFSGFENYNGAPIFYGLGNFSFDWVGLNDNEWNYGYGVFLKVGLGKKIDFEIIPYKQGMKDNPGIELLEETERVIFNEKINFLNTIIDCDDLLVEEFAKLSNSRQIEYEVYMQPYSNRILRGLYRRGLLPSFFSDKKKKVFLNLARCESHRDLLFDYLSKK
ncbi:capsule synthesis protein PGA_cap [Myroides phaeus]|uniref:Capsule synthesis protein PGA_cap n=2 Tax=Myroides phaeus TaxID=702745 RepID=A0A1G8CKV7_9FLAO|nr:capsule synthesis protein PGA_cap [Myroides phaeus]